MTTTQALSPTQAKMLAAAQETASGTIFTGNGFNVRTALALEAAGLVTVTANSAQSYNRRSGHTTYSLDWYATLTEAGWSAR